MRTFAHDELAAFVYREARLLDERRYEDWLALYADDARYWMPLSPDQPDSVLHGALMDEDRLLLRIRIERLAGRRTFSQQPASRGHHLLQQPYVERADRRAACTCCARRSITSKRGATSRRCLPAGTRTNSRSAATRCASA